MHVTGRDYQYGGRKLESVSLNPCSRILSMLILTLILLGRAWKEIKHYQNDTGLVFSRAAFARIVGTLLNLEGYNLEDGTGNGKMRVSKDALHAMQEFTEQLIAQEFQMAALETVHSKRLTTMVEDMHAVAEQRYYSGKGYFYAVDEKLRDNMTHKQALLKRSFYDDEWQKERTPSEETKERKKSEAREAKQRQYKRNAAARKQMQIAATVVGKRRKQQKTKK